MRFAFNFALVINREEIVNRVGQEQFHVDAVNHETVFDLNDVVNDFSVFAVDDVLRTDCKHFADFYAVEICDLDFVNHHAVAFSCGENFKVGFGERSKFRVVSLDRVYVFKKGATCKRSCIDVFDIRGQIHRFERREVFKHAACCGHIADLRNLVHFTVYCCGGGKNDCIGRLCGAFDDSCGHFSLVDDFIIEDACVRFENDGVHDCLNDGFDRVRLAVSDVQSVHTEF